MARSLMRRHDRGDEAVASELEEVSVAATRRVATVRASW
jgi:hypothetical protein